MLSRNPTPINLPALGLLLLLALAAIGIVAGLYAGTRALEDAELIDRGAQLESRDAEFN